MLRIEQTLALMSKPDSGVDLVARLQRGDEAAFEELIRTHSGRLLSVARRFLSNNEDAQDAVQDAFIRAFKAIHTFEARAQLHTWLHRILVNTALMKLREQRRRPTASIEDLLPTFTTDGHQTVASRDWSDAILERKETAAIVRAAIAMLPDPYREVLLLRDIEDRDTAEVAQILSTSSNVVKVRLHRARQALRTLLDREFRTTTPAWHDVTSKTRPSNRTAATTALLQARDEGCSGRPTSLAATVTRHSTPHLTAASNSLGTVNSCRRPDYDASTIARSSDRVTRRRAVPARE